MPTKIFVNLPVKDLKKSMSFFETLGYGFNEQFTDETAACMVIAEDIYAMLLTEAKFKDFTRKPVADATKVTEVLTALSVESRARVDALVDTALKAGATEAGEEVFAAPSLSILQASRKSLRSRYRHVCFQA